jgi:hypothetical protein
LRVSKRLRRLLLEAGPINKSAARPVYVAGRKKNAPHGGAGRLSMARREAEASRSSITWW